jgi:Lon protease-like protein
MEMLVNALCAGCPFSPVEKQALVEAETLKHRAEALIALLEMDVTGDDEGWMQ